MLKKVSLIAMALVWVWCGSAVAECIPTTWTLWAGQTIHSGTLSVTNDATNVYVTFTLDTATYDCATFGTLHLWLGSDLSLLPRANGKKPGDPPGAPIPGQFPFKADGVNFPSSTGSSTCTFTIPITDIPSYIPSCGVAGLYVVAHAEVNLCITGGGSSSETAFGGDQIGDGSRWWYYGIYTWCCTLPPDGECFQETAFAKGGLVWTKDSKSNPDGLPSWKLTNNRWGWVIEPVRGSKTYEIWAGAGLNKTANGTLVGILTVDWDGSYAAVTYALEPGYFISEAHLYVGPKMTNQNQLAPGRFGNTAYPEGQSTHTFRNLPCGPTDFIIAHLVVENEYCVAE
jgi:hypothetical protein